MSNVKFRSNWVHVLSSMSLTGLATLAAIFTGGIASFAAIWLVVVPLEAALSASRRVVIFAAIFALAAAGVLLLLGTAGFLPRPMTTPEQQSALAAVGIISATLYAAGLALGAELLVRTSFCLLRAERDRYHLLAHAMTDVIIHHGRNGAVVSVSPAAAPLIGVQANELMGNGLFERSQTLKHGCQGATAECAASLCRTDGAAASRPGNSL